jgi:hypothetical protein
MALSDRFYDCVEEIMNRTISMTQGLKAHCSVKAMIQWCSFGAIGNVGGQS